MRKEKVKIIGGKPDLTEMSKVFADQFNNGDPQVCLDKFNEMTKQLSYFTKVLNVLTKSAVMDHYPAERQALDELIASREKVERTLHISDAFVNPITHTMTFSYESVTGNYEQFRDLYASLKSSKYLKFATDAANAIHEYKVEVLAETDFVSQMSGSSWYPIGILNIKDVFVRFGDQTKTFFLLLLKKLYIAGYAVYAATQTPDVNIDQILVIFEQGIENLSKVPELSRCKNAISIINKSADMLRSNFGVYYRDFVSTGNPAVILESYILDVSKRKDMKPSILHELKQVVTYIRESRRRAQKTGTPTYEGLNQAMDQLDNSFSMLNKIDVSARTGDAGDDNDNHDDGDDRDDDRDDPDDPDDHHDRDDHHSDDHDNHDVNIDQYTVTDSSAQ